MMAAAGRSSTDNGLKCNLSGVRQDFSIDATMPPQPWPLQHKVARHLYTRPALHQVAEEWHQV